MLVPVQSLILEKRVKQRRDRQRRRIVQAAKTPSCLGSLGQLTLGAIGRSDRRPLQKGNHTQDTLVVLFWP